jgi:hypothetical protein
VGVLRQRDEALGDRDHRSHPACIVVGTGSAAVALVESLVVRSRGIDMGRDKDALLRKR